MNYSSTRDKNNPHWNTLFRHVRQLNDQLISIANFYLGDHVMARITDKTMLPKATSNIADACLEVTDATCVVMATMHSILQKYKIESKEGEKVDNINSDVEQKMTQHPQSIVDGSISIPTKEMNGVLSFVEIALLLSQKNKKGELEVLLLHTVTKIKKLLEAELHAKTMSLELESPKKQTRYSGPT